MAIELKVPTVGESITEVVIGEWLKKEGDTVAADESLVIIETDKVNVELPAPEAGVLEKILKGNGESANVGDVIGIFAPSGAKKGAAGKKAAEAPPEEKAEAKQPAAAAEEAPAPEPEKAEPAAEKPAAGKPAPKKSAAPEIEARVMPAAARLMAQQGVEAGAVEASGPGGRLLKEDVQRHLESRDAQPAPPAAEKPASDKAGAEKPAAPVPMAVAPTGSRIDEIVAMTPLRKRVAERLVEAKTNAALLTTFNEIDMTAAMELRKKHQDAFVAKYGIKLGFMSFFVKAAVDALRAIPQVNAEIRGTSIVYHNYQDIGVAVGGGKGLVVPILRNAESMSFAEVEKNIAALAEKAKIGKLTLDELQGGTFTISNGGIYGSLLSTPIVNPPQSGILGLHKIQERPIALNGQVVIRPMMYVALTYDHRIVDGREAVTFLVHIKDRLEDPARLLLEV
jgi:2-oxoglutarate dehydrogenase E2 component (dihydrolipoamide succinyltransferase)